VGEVYKKGCRGEGSLGGKRGVGEVYRKGCRGEGSLGGKKDVRPDYWKVHEKIKNEFLNVDLSPYQEVIPDLRVFLGVPSFDKAIGYGFTCCMLIPVYHPNHFIPNRISSNCGVVQCLMKLNGLQVFNQLKLSLEGITASILPTDEINDALRKVCESLNIPLGQAWVLNKKSKFVSSTYSSEKLLTLGPLILKSCG
nr:hypothetical protein [Tanacetum cinerariifolium]